MRAYMNTHTDTHTHTYTVNAVTRPKTDSQQDHDSGETPLLVNIAGEFGKVIGHALMPSWFSTRTGLLLKGTLNGTLPLPHPGPQFQGNTHSCFFCASADFALTAGFPGPCFLNLEQLCGLH